MKISKRDVKFFIIGAVAILLLDLILNWNEITTAAKEGFMKGLKGEPYNWIFFL